jgi:hypothetical protein
VTRITYSTHTQDNFAHDVVRYDNISGIPYQGLVSTLPDSEGSFEEVYEPVTDPLIKSFLETRAKIGHLPAFELQKWKRKMRMLLPFAHNLSQKEFVPTETFRLTRILSEKFPAHSLILSDFHALPDTIEGLNAPVVQTMFDGVMVPCSTYLVEPGWFDIFFPHDFTLLKGLYDYHAGQKQPTETRNKSEVLTYKAFLKRYGDPSQTRLQSGENPMLSYYENVSFLLS